MIDPRFPFHVARADSQGRRGQYLVFTRRHIGPLVWLEGAECVVEEESLEEFRALVEASEGKALATEWHISESTMHRIRAALGLAAEYTGSSRVTAWRRQNENTAGGQESDRDEESDHAGEG